MLPSRRFVIERLSTPIYRRITSNIATALENRGHEVHFIDPEAIDNLAGFLENIDSIEPDYLLLNSPRSLLTTIHPALGMAPFELIQVKLIFLHHDSCFCHLVEKNSISLLIGAYLRTAERSHHFCLEARDVQDLHHLGIDNASIIQHATEFDSPVEAHPVTEGISFVGHCVPDLGDACREVPFAHRIQADFWRRMSDLTHAMGPSAQSYALSTGKTLDERVGWQCEKSLYIGAIHLFSQEFRGELLQRILHHSVTIYGGDPAYLHGADLERKLPADRFHYRPPTRTDEQTKGAYRHSRVSLNITALQFDGGVVNRVIDCAGAGGFPLTDYRPGLERLTSVAQEICYHSPEELNHKLEFYLHADNQNKRQEIIATLQSEIRGSCSYLNIIDQILSGLASAAPSIASQLPRPLQVDLGCGPSKPAGFIGLDSCPLPGVDIVADLQKPFPFRDDSVDVVRAHDTIEHLRDPIHTMNEIWRICRPGGLVDIRVPSTDGRGAFQDPTHISYWNINSFKYYTNDYPEYLKLCGRYGFLGSFSLLQAEEEHSPDGVVHIHVKMQAVKPSGAEVNIEELAQRYDLRQINVMLTTREPWDPNQDQQKLTQVCEVITHTSRHAKGGKTCLVIDSGEQDPQQLGEVLTSLMLQLIEESLDTPGNQWPGIAIIGMSASDDLNERNDLLPLVQGRLDLSNDPLAALELLLDRIPTD
jgi:SAM-dependent methyltransferase